MNRIDQKFSDLKTSGDKAFVAYLVAGDPNLERTAQMIEQLDEVGVSVVELGVPFSDPLADGVVNQLGSQRALEAGTTVAKILEMVKDVRTRTQVPIVLFTYYNPIFKYGVDQFSQDAAAAGVDGVLVLDLPPEEVESEWNFPESLQRISLIAPTTPNDRITEIAQASSGFIYYVSREGVTGMQDSLPTNIESQLNAIKAATDLPICVGFGISNPEQAASVARFADGVVVGSAIVDRIGKWGNSPELENNLSFFVKPMVDAIRNPDNA
ncbi:MAG: tryptophan synthase subunit alpha [Gammaproteobacteria bacterium]|nr:tryptophan synthase subunit alpha [Gammaproteobacteria bacterium]